MACHRRPDVPRPASHQYRQGFPHAIQRCLTKLRRVSPIRPPPAVAMLHALRRTHPARGLSISPLQNSWISSPCSCLMPKNSKPCCRLVRHLTMARIDVGFEAERYRFKLTTSPIESSLPIMAPIPPSPIWLQSPWVSKCPSCPRTLTVNLRSVR